jgi:prephenate dehydrogenase
MKDEPGFETDFRQCKVAIWGLGLMGGSLGLALSGKCASLIGIDPDPRVVELAEVSQAFTQVSNTPQEVIGQADLVILAAPVRAILQQIAALPGLHRGPCTVLDLGSSKREIMKAMANLPPQFDPIGGHPMCGNEHSSFRHAAASLYAGAPFALVCLPRSSSRAQTLAEACVRSSGAQPLWMDGATHDRSTAYTSHLPYLIASALAASVPPAANPLAGPGLRSTTRLAGASPAMMLDILMTNDDLLLEALQTFRDHLSLLESDLRQTNEAALLEKLRQANAARNTNFSGDGDA